MGLSSSSQKTETRPIYAPQLEAMAGNVNSAYQSQAPKITAITDQLATLAPGLLKQYTDGDPGVNAARGYNQDVLGGKYLDAGNPYLEAMVQKAESDARNQTSAALGVRGLNGGSAFGDIISRNVAQAGTNLRYTDYGNERTRMDQQAALSPSLAAAQYLPIGVMQQIAQSQAIPLQAASGAAAATGGLLGQYTNQTGTSNPSLMSGIKDFAGTAASIASIFSDRRLKTDVRRVGATDNGVPVYTYRYGGSGPFHMGVMADEAPKAALGPVVEGYATVDYSEVR